MEDVRKIERIKERYIPPGIILEISDAHGNIKDKSFDLLNLTKNSDIDYIIKQMTEKEPLTLKYKSELKKLIESKNK